MLITLSISCKRDTDIVDPAPVVNPGQPTTPATGAVTPVAAPEGAAITAIIGPAGGTIESADKRIQVQIPAGALTTSQTISVQPLGQNNCPAGSGQAFRLTPHGLTFAKPATVTFQYTSKDVNGTAPELLRVAYQTDKGSWQSPSVKGLDTTARTVSIQTTHFSDWGLFKSMYISPDQSFVNPGGSQQLRVFQMGKPLVEGDELFVPLPTLVDTKYIEKWSLAGAGTLAHQHNTGDYYAPETIPATNPVSVTVFLNKTETIDGKVYKDLRLVTSIFVAPEGVSIQIGAGGAWQTFPGGANINSTQNIILGKTGDTFAMVGWVGKPTGVYQWTAGTTVSFVSQNGPTMTYSHLYGKNVSGGSLQVNNEHETWVVGTFTLTSSGWIESVPPPKYGTTSIRGVFRVKRV